MGSQCGRGVWTAVQGYFNGAVEHAPVAVTIEKLDEIGCAVRYKTKRGFYYKLQSAADLGQGFADETPGSFSLALDGSAAVTNLIGSGARFYRVLSSPTP